MESDEDSFSVLRLLETPHCFEPCIEVTDIRLQSVRGGGNTGIDEVCEGMSACLSESFQHIVMNGIETEDIHFNETFQMLPAQKKCCGRCIQQKMAVSVEDSFLPVPRMMTESLELQSGLEVPQQMDVTALHVCPICLKHLCEPR